jgi:YmgG-like glycine-zipper protein
MRRVTVLVPVFLVLLLASCAKEESAPAASDAQHAKVDMRDGTSVSGNVVSSTASDITLAPDGGGTNRTISMKQVKSVSYDDAPAAPAASAAPEAAPAAATASGGAKSSAPAASKPDAHENHFHPEKTAIQTKTFVVPVGTEVPVRTEETIDSGTAVEGQTFAAEIDSDVRDANKDVVIPRGANAQIVIKSASKGGKIRGASDLVIDLQSVSIGGQQYALSTTDLAETGKDGVGENKRTAKYVGGGAAVGAIIGAIAGHGKGAAIGAGSGAVAGGAAQVLTKGGSISIPAESLVTFKLDQPLKVVQRK